MHSAVREDGNEVVTEFVEQVPQERVLKYLPVGNYKWCVFYSTLKRVLLILQLRLKVCH